MTHEEWARVRELNALLYSAESLTPEEQTELLRLLAKDYIERGQE